jgi:hypothetical protein
MLGGKVDFIELVDSYPKNEQSEFVRLFSSFVIIQKQLQDLSDPKSKGVIVNQSREIAQVLKDPPWDLTVSFLWSVILDLGFYEQAINDWLTAH